MMRTMQGAMGPGGIQPDQLSGGGGGPDVTGILNLIDTAPPQILMLLKQAIDAKLAASQGAAGPGGPPPGGGAPPMGGPPPGGGAPPPM